MYLLLVGVGKVLLLHLGHDEALVRLVARHRTVVESVVVLLVSERERLGKVFQLGSDVRSGKFGVTAATPVPHRRQFTDLEKLTRAKRHGHNIHPIITLLLPW